MSVNFIQCPLFRDFPVVQNVLKTSLMWCHFFFIVSQTLFGQQPEGACSLRMELEGTGVVIVKSQQTSSEGHTSQVILEKPGGTKHVLAESKALNFVSLLRGDIDGDQIPEVVAIAKNPLSDDVLPYVFQGKPELKQVFPLREEDNPIIGKEIGISPGKAGSDLFVKELVNFHDFGPPDLYINELFQLRSARLVKVGERVIAGNHFNQVLNLGALAFQKGDFLEALKKYETVLNSSGSSAMPAEAQAIAWFYQGEARKFLKDFSGAIENYLNVVKRFPESAVSEQAAQEEAFLSSNQAASQALSLYIDALKLEKGGKLNEALALLDKGIPLFPKNQLGDYLRFLRGEILILIGYGEEALKNFRDLKKEFPNTPLRSKIDSTLLELETNPDEME